MIKTLLATLGLVIAGFSAYSCSCTWPPFDLKHIENSGYIALVKIKEILPPRDTTIWSRGERHYRITFEEIRRYKGPKLDTMGVYGMHPKFNGMTSCDVGVEEGAEWLIIESPFNGNYVLSSCSNSSAYRSPEGFRDLRHNSIGKRLKLLDSVFNMPALENSPYRGREVLRYPNGKVERTASYRKGKLHGLVNHYHPDGKLTGTEQYRRDKLHGERKWFNYSGETDAIGNFRKGKPIGKHTWYFHANQPRIEISYDKNGQMQQSIEWSPEFTSLDGAEKSYFILNRTWKDKKTGTEISVYYLGDGRTNVTYSYPDGRSISCSNDAEGRTMTYSIRQKDGSIHSRFYDKLGLVIKEETWPAMAPVKQ